MGRPTKEDVKDQVALALGAEIHEWVGNANHPGFDYNNMTKEEYIKKHLKDFESIMRSSSHADGYHLARMMENQGWEPDSELVELLDGVWAIKGSCLRKAVKAWVKQEGIAPCHAVGDIISHDHTKEGQITCEVVEIDGEMGEYLLFCEALGHVRKEAIKDRLGGATLGIIVSFEAIDTELERITTTPLFQGENQ